MVKYAKSNPLLFYFLISAFFMDLVFRISILKVASFMDILVSFLLLSVIIIGFYLITSFFEHQVTFILSCSLLGLLAFIYASQLLYFQFFKTLYSVYSLMKSTQVFEFWNDVGIFLLKNAIWILFLFLPVFLLIAYGNKYFTFTKATWITKMTLICLMVLTQLVAIGAIYAGGKETNTAYDFYYKNSLPLLSSQRLGLLTTMRLDLQRMVTGWSPELDVPPHVQFPTNTDVKSEPPQKQSETVDRQPVFNVLEIDFPQLIANESDDVVIDMHKYFTNVQPTSENEYTGKYEGYNLILITAEGFSPYAVQPDVTPTLYKLVNEGLSFTDFYTPIWGVSTSDGEYVALNSLIPKSGVWSFYQSSSNSLPFVLGNQLTKKNYKSMAYHNHTYTYYGRDTSHPNMGYDYKGLGNGLDVEATWPESDLEMMQKTVPEYIHNEPFHAYYMTVSGHMQYSFTGNYIAWKNKEFVEDLLYSEQAKAYLATQIELDRALEHLLDQLEKEGVADNTLIALSSDHYPYGLDEQTIDEFVGHPVEKNFELYKSTFILYNKGMKPETITKPVSSLDILPTISNLLGLKYDSRLLMGTDIFSDSMPLVVFSNKSFITDKGRYNSITNKFIPTNNEEVNEDYLEYMKSVVQSKFYYSTKILETDYYNKLFGNK